MKDICWKCLPRSESLPSCPSVFVSAMKLHLNIIKKIFFLYLVFKCLTIKTVHGRRIYHTWEALEGMVADKSVDVDKVITHRFPMSQFEEAFKVLFNGTACKIVMDPSK